MIDLSGRWQFRLDPHNRGIAAQWWAKPFHDAIRLPGTTSQARKGNPLTLPPVLPKPAPENWNPKHGLTYGRNKSALKNSPLAHLYQRFSYIGPA